MNTRSPIGFGVLWLIAMSGWFYGFYAGRRARRHHVGDRPFRWTERTRWGELTATGQRWQLRSVAGFATFVILILLSWALWHD